MKEIFTQISQKRGSTGRLKSGEQPVAEIVLQEGEYVIDVDWYEHESLSGKTSTWTWWATTVLPLP